MPTAIDEKAKYRRAKATKALDDIDAQRRAIDPTYPGRPKYDVEVRRPPYHSHQIICLKQISGTLEGADARVEC
jgi:hypothetical protein